MKNLTLITLVVMNLGTATQLHSSAKILTRLLPQQLWVLQLRFKKNIADQNPSILLKVCEKQIVLCKTKKDNQPPKNPCTSYTKQYPSLYNNGIQKQHTFPLKKPL